MAQNRKPYRLNDSRSGDEGSILVRCYSDEVRFIDSRDDSVVLEVYVKGDDLILHTPGLVPDIEFIDLGPRRPSPPTRRGHLAVVPLD
jgi:hypothetical protein